MKKTIRIALIKTPPTYANWYRRPVLGLSYLSGYLESLGHETRIFDAYFNSWTQQELVREITQYKPDLLGFSAMTHEIHASATMAAKLKEQLRVPAIIGGPHVTALPEQTLAEFPTFDYGVYGEGEFTLAELAGQWEAKDGLHGINGLIHREGEKIIVNPARPFMNEEELNRLPRPAFSHYYGENRTALHKRDAYYVMFTSRGCPYACAFCMQVLGRQVRRRSMESVLEEMEFAAKHYGAHTFDFADEIFLMNVPQTFALLNEFIRRGYPKRFRWSGLTRANFVNDELIGLAKRAGCYRLAMGVESGDEAVLKHIDKRITIEQVQKAVETIKRHKIPLGTYYILGHPHETPESANKTVNLAVSLNTSTIAMGIMVPYPGTRVYDLAVKGEGGYRLLSRNWADYDKYGGRALEIDGLPYEDMERLQQKAILQLYLKNHRYLDAVKYFWERRWAIYYLLKKRLFSRGK